MSYEVIDSEGDGGQIATNAGIHDLEALKFPQLKRFLDTGVIEDKETLQELLTEVEGDKVAGYLVDILSSLKPPIALTNGVT